MIIHRQSKLIYLLLTWLLFISVACNLLGNPGSNPSHTTQVVVEVQDTLVVASASATETKVYSTDAPDPSPGFIPTSTPTPSAVNEQVRFVVIGDYGEGNQAEQDVSELVKSWNPDLIITVGDNNYPIGSAETIDQNIGRYYQEFIHPYLGLHGPGASKNRFFPTLGNHDWDTPGAQPYLDYFTLPGNERYYDFTWALVHFFAINSDSREPDGVSPISVQAQWLEQKLKNSTLPWKIVYFHHPPFSSGYHGPVDWMRWSFKEWGASAVLSGHDHLYERLLVEELPYFINGLGGGPIYSFVSIASGSQVRYNEDYGAMLVTADTTNLIFQFYNRTGKLIDEYRISQ